MDLTAIKYSGQGSFNDWQTFIFTENHRHLPIASVNDPYIQAMPLMSDDKNAMICENIIFF